jgi:glycosyltransferase involved in cell wall biosynthesis
LRALAGLLEYDWELELVGEGSGMAHTAALAGSLGIGGRVHFRGQRMDVDRILAGSQISLLVSNYEGFPLSILEAMRAGLPVVASAVGGVEESVHDGRTGFLVPRGDADLLRDRIGRLLADPALRLGMGGRGRAEYERRFTLDHMVARTLAVYRDALAAADRAAPDRSARSPREPVRQAGDPRP